MDGALVGGGCWLTVAQKYHSPNRVQSWNVFNCKSISSSAQYVTLRKYVFTYKFSYVLFCNPPIKLKLGQQIGRGLLIANHLGQIRNTQQQLHHIYYTLFCRCVALLRFLPAMATHAIMRSQNHFPEPNQHTLDFPHPILLCTIELSWRCAKYSDPYSFT